MGDGRARRPATARGRGGCSTATSTRSTRAGPSCTLMRLAGLGHRHVEPFALGLWNPPPAAPPTPTRRGPADPRGGRCLDQLLRHPLGHTADGFEPVRRT